MRVISLFSGAGGMDLGFRQAGHQIIWANDSWEDAAKTYQMNIGSHITCVDLGKVRTQNIPDGDIVIGGFPCQGFSVANMNRREGDGRNLLYREFVRVLKAKKPMVFLAENVKGILSLDKGKVFGKILTDFERRGYRMNYAVLNAADFGVPQRRERVFIFGIRDDVDMSIKFPPSPTHALPELCEILSLKPRISIGEALKGLPDPDEGHDLANHEYTKYKLRFNGYLGHRRIDPDLPCPTITARGDMNGGVVIHHHPSNTRRLSAREVAIIQSFPRDFVFYGTKTSVYRQAANAVPPLLARAIAQQIPLRRKMKKNHLRQRTNKAPDLIGVL